MRSSSSDFAAKAPEIPDHEVIRQIGKGSYGEVWLGRSVTGALRAIKVVSRADFEYDRTFEREFEGIKKFEPISRTHPGLVDILHVGRNLSEGFYYYVMELGDDRLSGSDIVAELYVPRTLSSDAKEKGQIPVDACADWGAMLADALQHMHSKGLAHRDVKPSNIIFVDGVPKLADIGLVALSGQRTFVGTEGFVPPEGPGEPGADIYSLGMVLYETSTGMDRLDFPAVPTLTGDETEKKKWRRLNTVVCKACAPSPKQRYSSARDMRHALVSILSRSLEPPPFGAKLLRTVVFSGLLAAALLALRNQDLFAAYREGGQIALADLAPQLAEPNGGGAPALGGNLPLRDTNPPPPPPVIPLTIDVPSVEPEPPVEQFGSVKVISVPRGAMVYRVEEGGEKVLVGETRPDYFEPEVLPGEVAYELVLEGYRNLPDRGFVQAGKTLLLGGEMQFYQPPIIGQPWTNSNEIVFEADGQRHVSLQPIPIEVFENYLEDRVEENIDFDRATVFPEGDNSSEGYPTVKVNRQVARDFFGWLSVEEVASGYISEDQYYSLHEGVECGVEDLVFGRASGLEERFPLFPVVQKLNFASLRIDSEPRGAGIYIDGEYRGTTQVDVPSLRPGPIEVTVRLAGYRQQVKTLELQPGEKRDMTVVLEASMGVVFGKPWVNGMGMRLLPLGDDVMLGAWEVRASDVDAFCASSKREPTHKADFEQAPDHPAVRVNHRDAVAFCEWLTERERGEGLIDPRHEYRLPTDREWSRAAGLEQETGKDPAARDGQVKDRFLWDGDWPPPSGVVNLADAAASSWLGANQVLAGYDDGFAHTSPVGKFTPNAGGFYDLAGNVWEWVAEPYGGQVRSFKSYAVARGGGYDSSRPDHFLASYRNVQPPDTRDTIFGFRVVLAVRGTQLD